jgi:endonuclease/exonuclease/phosphatase (EEP) superfamily protein YafD
MSHPPINDVADSRARRWLARLFYAFLWLVTLALLSIAALRMAYQDGTHLLTWLNAFTRYIYLPAYFCLICAVWKCRWLLAAANLIVVSLHLAWIAPDFLRDDRFDRPTTSPSAAQPAPPVRIFFANVRNLNKEHDALLKEIQEADPDVIVLVEFSWLWHLAYLHSPFFKAYPYGGGMANDRLGKVSVFSRLPLASNKEDEIAERAIQTIEVPVGNETLKIIGLHAPRPMDVLHYDYEGYWNEAARKLLAEKGPLVVVGDFNATQYSRVYRRLTAFRFRSAHEDRGRGFATTWPNGYYWLPPIRIDQVLLSPEVECLDIREGEGRGSDHKPLIVDVRLRPMR